MNKKDISRRNFLKRSTLVMTGSALLPSILTSKSAFAATSDKNKMFCYQCEQTMKGKGCTRVGVWVAAGKAAIQRVKVPPCQLPDSDM